MHAHGNNKIDTDVYTVVLLPEVMLCMFTTCTQYKVSLDRGSCVAKQYRLY